MAPGWNDLRVTSFAPKGADAPVQADFPASVTYTPQTWQFQNQVSVNYLNAVSQMSHGIDLNQPVYLHLHLSCNSAMAEAAVLGLFVAFNVCQDGAVWGTEEIYWCSYTVPAGGILAKTHVRTVDVPLSVAMQAKMGMSAEILVSVFRHKGTLVATQNAGDITESLNDVVWFHECDLHYFEYRGGSRNHAAPLG
jgi:hypothetical protein